MGDAPRNSVPREMRCLGVPELAISGERVALTRQQTRLLCVLAAAGVDGLDTDQLLFELYGDALPRSRDQAIYSLVNRVNSHGEAVVVNERGRYRLADDLNVDVWAFLSSQDDITSIVTALRLWRGSAFETVDAGPILQAAKADLARRRSHLVAAATREASPESLLPIDRQIRRAVDDDPYNESLAVAVAAWIYRQGRRRHALEILHMCRSRLRQDLGLDAGTALEDAELALLRNTDPFAPVSPGHAVDQAAEPTVAHLLRPNATIYVGRRESLDFLSNMLDNCKSAGRVVLIQGSAGMGKSELLRQFVDRGSGFSIRVGVPQGAASIAYAPWVRAFPELRREIDEIASATDASVARSVLW